MDDFRAALVEALVRATMRFIDDTPEPAAAKRRGRVSLADLADLPRTSAARLAEHIKAEDCPDLLYAARKGVLPFDDPPVGTKRRRASAEIVHGWAQPMASLVFGLLCSRETPFISSTAEESGRRPYVDLTDRRDDVLHICERVVALMCDDDTAELDVVVLDTKGLEQAIPVGAEWTLRPVTDAVMPVELPRFDGPGLSMLHMAKNCSLLTRPASVGGPALCEPGPTERPLTVPLLLLNLASTTPVRAVAAYRLRSGLEVVSERGGKEYVPSEVHHWHPFPRQLPRLLDFATFDAGTRVRLQELVARLHRVLATGANRFPKQYRDFPEVADRFLTVGYHRCHPDTTNVPGSARDDTRPFMHPSDAVARLAACAEKLMMAGRKGDLSRATSQRVALIAGRSDQERLDALLMSSAMYSMRSHHVHVAPRKDSRYSVDEIRQLVRHVIIGWMVLTAEYGPELPDLLDRSLVSATLRQDKIDTPLDDFWEGIGEPDAERAGREGSGQ